MQAWFSWREFVWRGSGKQSRARLLRRFGKNPNRAGSVRRCRSQWAPPARPLGSTSRGHWCWYLATITHLLCNYHATIMQLSCNHYAAIRQPSGNLGPASHLIGYCLGHTTACSWRDQAKFNALFMFGPGFSGLGASPGMLSPSRTSDTLPCPELHPVLAGIAEHFPRAFRLGRG
jgi:hypothetical protein